jgi:hypothetical protein
LVPICYLNEKVRNLIFVREERVKDINGRLAV